MNQCPECGSLNVTTVIEHEVLRWGHTFECDTPVRKCECGFQWIDSEGMEAHDLACFKFEKSKGIIRTKFCNEKERIMGKYISTDLGHEWREFNTGIGKGGYVECTVCWQNTYSDLNSRDGQCPVKVAARKLAMEANKERQLNPAYRRPDFETMKKEQLIALLDEIRDAAAGCEDAAGYVQYVASKLKVNLNSCGN